MSALAPTSSRPFLLVRVALLLTAAGLSVLADEPSMTEMARRYEHGIGCPRDIGRALFLYKRAAAAGEPAAMLALGDLYREGRCVDQDLAYSTSMYRRSAALGFAPAIFRLAEHGPMQERESLLRKAAGLGYGPAMTVLADLTGDPEWLRRAVAAAHPPAFAKLAARSDDAAVALQLLRRGVDLGDPAAQRELGLRLESTDREAALALFASAADAGDPRAMERRAHYASSQGEALVWYSKAAEAGIPEALHWMAARSDPAVARLLLKKAADAGHAPSMRKLALLTDNQNLLRAAADLGDADAMFRLGRADAAAARGHVEALAHLGKVEEAAKLGHAPSLLKLGRVREAAEAGSAEAAYRYGTSFEDRAEGTRWVARAAAARHMPAMRELGLRYRRGDGAPQDKAEGDRWMRQAADAGDPEALFHTGRVKEAAEKGYPPALAAMGDRTSLERAAAAGYANAWTKLGQLDKAAALGDAEAKVLIGNQKKRPREACALYREAADTGYVPAMLLTAQCHMEGRGASRSELDAVNWWRRAALAGSPEAAELLRKHGKGF